VSLALSVILAVAIATARVGGHHRLMAATASGCVVSRGLASVVFGPIMNTTASTLANWWRNHPVETPDLQAKN